MATRRIKYLGVYLPKETKDLYIENYKTLMKRADSFKKTLLLRKIEGRRRRE